MTGERVIYTRLPHPAPDRAEPSSARHALLGLAIALQQIRRNEMTEAHETTGLTADELAAVEGLIAGHEEAKREAEREYEEIMHEEWVNSIWEMAYQIYGRSQSGLDRVAYEVAFSIGVRTLRFELEGELVWDPIGEWVGVVHSVLEDGLAGRLREGKDYYIGEGYADVIAAILHRAESAEDYEEAVVEARASAGANDVTEAK